jgi:hypothetical protein
LQKKELNDIKKNYQDLFKNYQNNIIEMKEKDKIYKNFQIKYEKNKMEQQNRAHHHSKNKNKEINYYDNYIPHHHNYNK